MLCEGARGKILAIIIVTEWLGGFCAGEEIVDRANPGRQPGSEDSARVHGWVLHRGRLVEVEILGHFNEVSGVAFGLGLELIRSIGQAKGEQSDTEEEADQEAGEGPFQEPKAID